MFLVAEAATTATIFKSHLQSMQFQVENMILDTASAYGSLKAGEALAVGQVKIGDKLLLFRLCEIMDKLTEIRDSLTEINLKFK